jgi:hypothetical protein
VTYPASKDNISTVISGQTVSAAGQNQIINAVNGIEDAWDLNPARALCEGRLTLTTGVPITTSDVTGATTVYFTPYQGNRISLYDGTSVWEVFALTSDLSLAISGVSANKNYDVFCYDDSGTPTLELGPAWTNDSTRATDLVLQDGIWVKSGDTTRRYLGSLRIGSGGTSTEDSLVRRFLFNANNRVPRPLRVTESTASWSYSTASWQQANASTANQVEVMVGLTGIMTSLQADGVRSNGTAGVGATGIGIGSTSAMGTGVRAVATSNAASAQATSSASWQGFPSLGWSYYAWLEYGSGAGTDTWYGISGQLVTGLSGWLL